jgi:hypothetical protein
MNSDERDSKGNSDQAAVEQAIRDEQIWLSQIPKAYQSRLKAKSLASVLDKLIIEKGYSAEQSMLELREQWTIAVGEELAAQSRVGKVRRGTLQIYASNPIVMSELDLCRRRALQHLQKVLPDFKIKALKINLLK